MLQLFARFRGVLTSDLSGTLTNMCLNIMALSPQKLVYVALQETWKLLINRKVSYRNFEVAEVCKVSEASEVL